MKIEFIEAPKGRDYKAGDIVEFKGRVDEGYALKYISRGWAKPYDESAIKAAEKAAREEEARLKAEADAKARDDAAARAKADAEAAANASAKANKTEGSGKS